MAPPRRWAALCVAPSVAGRRRRTRGAGGTDAQPRARCAGPAGLAKLRLKPTSTARRFASGGATAGRRSRRAGSPSRAGKPDLRVHERRDRDPRTWFICAQVGAHRHVEARPRGLAGPVPVILSVGVASAAWARNRAGCQEIPRAAPSGSGRSGNDIPGEAGVLGRTPGTGPRGRAT